MAEQQWEASSVKAQIRLASQRLGQIQDKNDSKGIIARKDVATLLQQSNVGLARTKAQNLIQEDAFGDILEMLGMQLGVILENFADIDQGSLPNPAVVEAASSIMFSAPFVNCKELFAVSNLLSQKLGSDFARSATTNRDNYVSPRIVKASRAAPPSAAHLDEYLSRIAKTYGVAWAPEPRRQDILNALSEILDPDSAPAVDMGGLRRLCARGIPDEPQWLRPRIWKLFLGTLPVLKGTWRKEIGQQRESYYDLVQRLLKPFTELPAPTSPLTTLDTSLLNVWKQFSSIPPSLFAELEGEPESSSLSSETGMPLADALDVRLKLLQDRSTPSVPGIRLEQEEDSQGIPDVFVTSDSFTSGIKTSSTLLVSPRNHKTGAHDKHTSALIRLLYVHSVINPGNLSPHIPALLLPLYTVLNREVEPDDMTHVEADVFWLFEAMIGEFSELEDEEGGNVWMKRFSERLSWADTELSENLLAKGLDPALPHYSYRWLAPLLIHTLPLASVIVAWDALFSRPMRQKDNPKLEYLLDICTSMLIRAKPTLLRLGKAGPKSPSLWSQDIDSMPPPSPVRAWELGDAFLEGMSLLQHYPIDAGGGIDRILQTASDLRRKREQEAKSNVNTSNLSVGARLRDTIWKGFTNQLSSELSPTPSETSDDESSAEDGNATEKDVPTSPGLTSRLATTVWRGITNQSSMDPPASPMSPNVSPLRNSLPSPSPSSPILNESLSPGSDDSRSPSGIWGYAEKLRDSDAAASLAKFSSNWRAKAMLTSWNAGTNRQSVQEKDSDPFVTEPGPRRGSLPTVLGHERYSPPTRPAYFRPPRDTMVFTPHQAPVLPSSGSPELSPQSDSGILQKTKNLQASLAALTKSEAPRTPKAGPRPLLLSSSSLITPRDVRTSRSETSTPTFAPRSEHSRQWSEVMQAKRHALNRDSQSSVSSLSPSDALGRRSDRESEGTTQSRKVPLNRRSVSPMAPHHRTASRQFSYSSSERGLLSPSSSILTESAPLPSAGEARTNTPESPPPTTPPKRGSAEVQIKEGEHTQDTFVLNEPTVSPLVPPRKLSRKRTPSPANYRPPGDTSDSAPEAPSISPRVRAKRYPSRPAQLRLQESNTSNVVAEQNDTLDVEWPRDDPPTHNTPKASDFDSEVLSSPSPTVAMRRPSVERPRKISSDGTPSRKTSADSRTRKTSGNSKRSNRESAADDGDDEGGYDDLLSAYESEEGSKSFL